jgi:hypothetical protein
MPDQADCEIVCFGFGARRVRLFPPILGTMCSRCSSRSDDVCFIFEGPEGIEASGGLCGPCLSEILLDSIPLARED